jgi:hypothetical protein
MKNEFFVQKKRKLPSAILFVIPSRTLLHNIGSFEQNMP